MLYITLLEEVMDSPHKWEDFNGPPTLDDRSEMTINIDELIHAKKPVNV